MSAYQVGKNPFMSDADDDFSFGGGGSRSGPTGFSSRSRDDELFSPSYSTSTGDPSMSRYEQLQQQKQQSMNRQLESTNRCLASIYDSEQIGIATAEELVAQGEQLDNVERKLDKILVDTKTSQRHLNGIKSIFGGLKNWWTGDGKKEEAVPAPLPKKRSETLEQAMAAGPSSSTHPSLQLRSGNVRGFYDDDVVEFNPNSSAGYGSQSSTTSVSSARQGVEPRSAAIGGFQVEAQSTKSSEWQEYEENLNKNLDSMSLGMSRLKMLATGLGEEIEDQNSQIEDRIMVKAEKADIKIRDQNRQMRKILGK